MPDKITRHASDSGSFGEAIAVTVALAILFAVFVIAFGGVSR